MIAAYHKKLLSLPSVCDHDPEMTDSYGYTVNSIYISYNKEVPRKWSLGYNYSYM